MSELVDAAHLNTDSMEVSGGLAAASSAADDAEEAAMDVLSTSEAAAAVMDGSTNLDPHPARPNGGPKAVLDGLLFSYQREGIAWMREKVREPSAGGGYRGCILGDEPGVGKTLQVIGLVLQSIWSGEASRVLVAAPNTLVLSTWQREFERWLPTIDPSIKYVIAAGSIDASERALRRLQSTRRPHHLVVVCSYEQLRAVGMVWLADVSLDLLVCDEAHRLVRRAHREPVPCKSPPRRGRKGAQLPKPRLSPSLPPSPPQKSRSIEINTIVRSLPSARTARVAVTATPAPNNLREFYELLDFVCPGILGDEEYFVKGWVEPIEAGKAADADAEARCVGDATLAAFHQVAGERLLVRTKAETNAAAASRAVSHTYVVVHSISSLERSLFSALAARPGIPFGGVGDLLNALMHPELLKSRPSTAAIASANVVAWPETPVERVELSSKLTLCVQCVAAVAARGERAVVIVRSRLVGALLADRLRQMLGGRKGTVLECNGNTKSECAPLSTRTYELHSAPHRLAPIRRSPPPHLPHTSASARRVSPNSTSRSPRRASSC